MYGASTSFKAATLVLQHDGIRGFYCGFWTTIMREVIEWIFFTSITADLPDSGSARLPPSPPPDIPLANLHWLKLGYAVLFPTGCFSIGLFIHGAAAPFDASLFATPFQCIFTLSYTLILWQLQIIPDIA
jgi:hypothetical protein